MRKKALSLLLVATLAFGSPISMSVSYADEVTEEQNNDVTEDNTIQENVGEILDDNNNDISQENTNDTSQEKGDDKQDIEPPEDNNNSEIGNDADGNIDDNSNVDDVTLIQDSSDEDLNDNNEDINDNDATVQSYNDGIEVFSDDSNITTSTEDTTPPEFVSISIDKTEVEAPGTVYVTVEATDDISGLSGYCYLSFYSKERGKSISTNLYYNGYNDDDWNWHQIDDGKLHGIISTTQYTLSGEYVLASITIADNAGNLSYYYGNGYGYNSDNLVPEDYRNLKITVTRNGKTPDLTTSTSSGTLASDITDNVSDGGEVVVDYSNNSNVSSDVFTALAGTDKTATFTSGGISWQFNGSDINADNAKNIDLNVSVSKLSEESAEDAETINKISGEVEEDNSALVLHFADNGTLPGKATIRVKADYALRQYLGTTGLKLYYFDTTENKLVLVNTDITMEDDNIIFEIEHCSYYVIVGKPVNDDLGNNSSSTNTTTSSNNSSNNSSSNSNTTSTSVKTPTYEYTAEERVRMSFVGKEKINAILGIENKYGVIIQNSIQGPKCIDVFNFVKGDYTIGRTYNIFPNDEFGTHSKDTSAKITLTIPKDIYSPDRTYEMICVGENGVPYILEDLDDTPTTITFETSNFYAFALCYK